MKDLSIVEIKKVNNLIGNYKDYINNYFPCGIKTNI